MTVYKYGSIFQLGFFALLAFGLWAFIQEPSWKMGLSLSIAAMGFMPVISFRVEKKGASVEAFYAFGKKRIPAYSYRLADVQQIDYSSALFGLACLGRKKSIIFPSTIYGYQDILKSIVIKSPNLAITPAARKKMVRDGIL
jgi:hypothetical protein